MPAELFPLEVMSRLPASAENARMPALVQQAGPLAGFAFDEFFHGQIRNPWTRNNYQHSLRLFSAWCEARQLELRHVLPSDVGRFLDGLPVSIPTRKLHLAALRRFFDELVLCHVLLLNPALSVRGERYQVVEGRTPEIPVEQARQLLQSLDVSQLLGTAGPGGDRAADLHRRSRRCDRQVTLRGSLRQRRPGLSPLLRKRGEGPGDPGPARPAWLSAGVPGH